MRAGAQKPRLGGHFSAPSYKKFDLKMKKFDFFTDFVSFELFPLYLAYSYFLRNLRSNLKVCESCSSKT